MPRISAAAQAPIVPFLKWAGGKRWFAQHAPKFAPSTFERYVEPFLGSGALYFALQPKKALLADVNSTLIETYVAIRDDWERVQTELGRHQANHSSAYYYKERCRKYRSPSSRAAQLIYLNRTCWNGLYRVNLAGQFNVPIGTKTAVLLDSDDFKEVAGLLRRARIVCSDFEPIVDQCRRGDFVFVDPPYTVKHNMNGFVKYNERLFSWEDQVRLRDSVVAASKRGARLVVTNADHPSIEKLYADFGKIRRVSRASVLAANARFRSNVGELVITL